jgi:hypothetical protein
MHMTKTFFAKVWEMWRDSLEGQECRGGTAEGIYLENRLHRAFMAGYDAAKSEVGLEQQ